MMDFLCSGISIFTRIIFIDKLPLLSLAWGALGEGSPAGCAPWGSGVSRHGHAGRMAPSTQQMGLEVTAMRRRLSTAAIRASNTMLVARQSQVGEGSGLAERRRELQRREERAMGHGREAD